MLKLKVKTKAKAGETAKDEPENTKITPYMKKRMMSTGLSFWGKSDIQKTTVKFEILQDEKRA
jgi:hypothetical protein